MKKLILLVFSLAMLLSLCACGGGTDTPKNDDTTPAMTKNDDTTPAMTKDEMLEQAEEVNASQLE